MSTELKIRRVGGSFMLHLTADVAKAMGAHVGQSILAHYLFPPRPDL